MCTKIHVVVTVLCLTGLLVVAQTVGQQPQAGDLAVHRRAPTNSSTVAARGFGPVVFSTSDCRICESNRKTCSLQRS